MILLSSKSGGWWAWRFLGSLWSEKQHCSTSIISRTIIRTLMEDLTYVTISAWNTHWTGNWIHVSDLKMDRVFSGPSLDWKTTVKWKACLRPGNPPCPCWNEVLLPCGPTLKGNGGWKCVCIPGPPGLWDLVFFFCFCDSANSEREELISEDVLPWGRCVGFVFY